MTDSFATRTVAATAPAAASESRISSARLSSRSQGRFAPGELLGGRYRIVAMLGKGGMGEVYRAEDLVLDQQVALKFLPEAVAHNERALERFRNEVRIARQVSHPNVCRVHDLGEMEGLYFLSMEYVDGEDLGSLLRRIGRLPSDKALEIARKLCAGLAAAHEKGVLHRDLKPSNVMLDGRGHVLLTDFGLAGLAGEIEGAEVRNGTPAYMAPEQLAGEEVTVRSDLYALGLVLYEIFTGKLPFESTTLAGLIQAQRESTPASPSTLVRDLDPMVERVILRCLQVKPSMRPVSALAVAAALPGGDPLAAALAAGETPSPEMVAAAGEGEGLALKYAAPLLLFVLIAMPIGFALRGSALTAVNPELGPEVLAQKSREIVAQFGGPKRPFDQAYSFEWDQKLFEWFSSRGGRADWTRVLFENPQALVFQYRSHTAPLTGLMFHDDLMTPGMISWDDPPFTESGMTSLQLDAHGKLLYFERLPLQVSDKVAAAPAAPDWNALFTAAGLDQSTFQPAEPLWTSLAAADTRIAWTRHSPREQRIEAASFRGQPVFFRIVEPWTRPDRMPGASDTLGGAVEMSVLGVLLVIIIVAAAALAVGNLRRQRGDRRGAFRIAIFTFGVHLAIWLTRGHFNISFGTFAGFLVALATSTFYAVTMWTVYIALEPYVRRRWPQALISWSTLWIGRVRDAVVGRDVLIGCAAGAFFVIVGGLSEAWLRKQGGWPLLDRTMPLSESRAYLAAVFMGFPNPIRNGLFFLLLIFLFRVALRNQWLAAVAFGVVFAAMSLADPSHPWFNFAGAFIVFFGLAFLVLRWGLLALCAEMLFNNLVYVPAAKTSAWYFGGTATLLLLAVALSAWAFSTSLGGRRLWKEGLFD
jgi:serine/threonine-protein kinase